MLQVYLLLSKSTTPFLLSGLVTMIDLLDVKVCNSLISDRENKGENNLWGRSYEHFSKKRILAHQQNIYRLCRVNPCMSLAIFSKEL